VLQLVMMHGLVRTAAVLLASTLVASGHPIVSSISNDGALPQAYIDLDVKKVIEDVLIPRTLLAFEVAETDSSCGRSNITLDGNILDENEDGVGAGTIVTKRGPKVGAEWHYSCVQVDDRQHFERVLNFNILEIDGFRIEDLKFMVQFQQIAPTGVSAVEGAFSIIRVPTSTAERISSASARGKPFNLQSELYELEVLNARLARIEFEITAKKNFIAHAFPNSDIALAPSMSKCSNAKCFVTTLWGKFRTLMSGLPDDGFHRDRKGMIIIPPSAPEDMDHPLISTAPEQHVLTLQSSQTNDLPALDATVQQVLSPVAPAPEMDTNTEYAPDHEITFGVQADSWQPSTAMLTTSTAKSLTIAGSALLLLGAIAFTIRAACTEKARARRTARRAARKARCEKREARLEAVKRTFAEMCSWVHERTTHKQKGGDEIEKDAAVRDNNATELSATQPSGPAGYEEYRINVAGLSWASDDAAGDHVLDCPLAGQDLESDEESTTMEQDLAHFRAVAGVMENLFTFPHNMGIITSANVGFRNQTSIMDRLRNAAVESRLAWPVRRGNSDSYSDPPSPTSSAPSYTSSDETLPSYESSTNSFADWN